MVRNLMLIFGLSLAVAAFGCESESTDNGDAGPGGSGGSGAAPVDQCSEADFLAIADGEPDDALLTTCSTAALGTLGDQAACEASIGPCLQADPGTTLSEGCSDCFAEATCCGLNQCSVLLTPAGPCGAPPLTPDCEACIAEKCEPRQEACMGGGGGAGGSGAGGSGAGGSGAGGSGAGGSGAGGTSS